VLGTAVVTGASSGVRAEVGRAEVNRAEVNRADR
jgi:hypothetical protein